MNPLRYPRLEVAALVLVSALILLGAARIPFHPDESSWLYQSRDLEALFRDPGSLAWTTASESSPDLTYRLLNAPLAKYVLGLARLAAGFSTEAVDVDWDWSLSWDQNVAASALPSSTLLLTGRVASALLLIPAVVAMYFSGRAIGGRTTGILAGLFLATNALVLLHGRRAMAEGALTLGVSLALLGLLQADRRPWLAGAAAGLAFAAKTSAGVWIPLGWIGAAWTSDPARRSLRGVVGRLAAFTLSSAVVVFVLHPVLWAEPLAAAGEMLRSREALVASQVEMIRQSMPWAAPTTTGERIIATLAQVFVAPPQFAEAANYLAETATDEAAYLSVPGNNLLRGFLGGGLMMVATILGIVLGVRNAATVSSSRREVALALLATVVQAAALVAFVPLAFQRYVLPLVPLVCLWAGHGVGRLIEAGMQSRRTRSPAAGE